MAILQPQISKCSLRCYETIADAHVSVHDLWLTDWLVFLTCSFHWFAGPLLACLFTYVDLSLFRNTQPVIISSDDDDDDYETDEEIGSFSEDNDDVVIENFSSDSDTDGPLQAKNNFNGSKQLIIVS